jgi:hypothetical protein
MGSWWLCPHWGPIHRIPPLRSCCFNTNRSARWHTLPPETLLFVVDLVIGAFLAVGVVCLKRVRPPAIHDIQGAFQVLDRSIERFVPDMPPGFTWTEAVQRLKESGVKADWARIESSLAAYEAFRYGGRMLSTGGEDEVVRLSMRLRRSIVGNRAKGKGTG